MKSYHAECKQLHDQATDNIAAAIERSWTEDRVANALPKLISKFASDGRVGESIVHQTALTAMSRLANHALADRLLTGEEEHRLMRLAADTGITPADLQNAGIAEPLAKAAVLRDLDSGVFKSRVTLEDAPIILGKNESVLWAFTGSTLMEYKTTSRTVGRSQGVSIRIMRGVYYRVGAFKGNRISETTLETTDLGTCVLTSANWYFWGPRRQVRTPLKSILSVQGYADGIEIAPTASTTRPKVFKLADPEFAASALTRAASLAR